MDELVKVILKKYKLEWKFIHPVQKGYRNKSYLVDLTDGSRINLIIYKREPGILCKILSAHAISNILKDELPVRYSLKPILKIKENLYACVYNYLPGSTIPWDGYTMDHLKLLGESLNMIHYLGNTKLGNKNDLLASNKNLFISEAENLQSILSRVNKYFQDKNVLDAVESKLKLKLNFVSYLKEFQNTVEKVNTLNESTFLHMDFVRGNILFDSKPDLAISGILDFEKASIGSPLFDIARTMAFLFVDCKYKSEDEIRKYFLKSGYIKRGKLKLRSYKYLNELVFCYLIYDFYKFLKHNPYEFLQQNEHFLKTKELLLKTDLITLL